MQTTKHAGTAAAHGAQHVRAEDDRRQIVDELESRAAFYRVMAGWYYRPFTQQQLDELDNDTLRQLAAETPDAAMADGYNDMYRYLRRRNTGTREDLSVDFTRCFMGTATFHGLTCSPYASLFLNPGGKLMGNARNQVRRFYLANGIELGEGIDLPEDHLSFELEFMAILGDRAAWALDKGQVDKAIEAVELQASFLDEHILSWTDRFFNLSVELVRTRFYRGVVKVTKAWLDQEMDNLAFLRDEMRALQQAQEDAADGMRCADEAGDEAPNRDEG